MGTSTQTPSANLGMPGNNVVCLYNVASAGGEDTISALAGYFRKKKYDVRPVMDATIDDLKHLPPCAIFYLNSHGGFGEIATATKVADYPSYASEREAGLVTSVTVTGDTTHTDYVAILSSFVQQYWHFPANSLVFINGCDVAFDTRQGTASIHDTLRSCNVTVLAGWTGENVPNCDSRNLYLFDRLLGTNAYGGNQETPPQRPFDVTSIYNTMRELGYDKERIVTDPKGGVTQLLVERLGQGDLGLLAPSIRRLSVAEDTQILTIEGLFSDDPSRLKVFVAPDPSGDPGKGLQLSVQPGDAGSIQCPGLPVSGPGSAGYVTVVYDFGNGGLVASNPVPLTAWHGCFTYTLAKPGSGPDSIVGTITWEPFLRGDVHSFRDKPHGGLVPYMKPFMMVEDPAKPAHFSSSGSYDDGENTVEWQGEGHISPVANADGALLTWGGIGVLGLQSQTQPGLTCGVDTLQAQVRVKPHGLADPITFSSGLGGEAPLAFFGVLGTFDMLKGKAHWDPDSGYDLPAGSISGSLSELAYVKANGGVFTARLEWQAMAAAYPPTSDTAA